MQRLTGKLFQDTSRVATFLDMNKQRPVFIAGGSLLTALTGGHLQSHPTSLRPRFEPVSGTGGTPDTAEGVALPCAVSISFCAGEKEPLLTAPGLDGEMLFWQFVILIK